MTLLPEYRAQLYDAAQGRARRPVRRVARSWPVAVSTLVAVGVVVVAVVALSHRQPSSSPAHSGSASSERQLLGMLGVLRRPQSNADLKISLPGILRNPGAPSCPHVLPCSFTVDRPLIRVVNVPGSRYQVGILPVSTPTPATGAGAIAGVALTLNGPGIYRAAGGPWNGGTTGPWGLGALRTRGLLLSAYVSDGINRGAILVPDGVSRVVIGPVHLLDTTITSRFAPTPGASAAVHQNIASFRLSGLTVKNLRLNPRRLGRFFSEGSGRGCRLEFAIYELPATATMTWFGSDGRLVNHVRINLNVDIGTHHPVPGTTTENPRCAASG